MKKSLLAILVLLFCGAAYAGDKSPPMSPLLPDGSGGYTLNGDIAINGVNVLTMVVDDYDFADATARDSYFTSNPSELVDGVQCHLQSTGYIQEYDLSGTSWVNLTALTKGPQGDAGAGSGDLLSTNNLSDVDNAATAYGNIKQSASTTATGAVELATNAETVTGTDATRAVTPDGLTDRLAAPGAIGGTTPDAGSFTSVNIGGTELDSTEAGYVDSITAYIATLLNDANEAAFKATTNLEIGTDVQAYDADLTTYAGITPTANAQSLLAMTYAQMAGAFDDVAWTFGAIVFNLSAATVTLPSDINYPADSVLPADLDQDGNYTSLTGDWATTGYVSGQANVQTDAAGAITITVNAVNYGTDTGDADIPDGACDAAADVGNWVVFISDAADQYSLTSNDASNIFILDDLTALDAGDELDVDGSMVCVMCIAAEYWKVTGYIDTAPTDGGAAD